MTDRFDGLEFRELRSRSKFNEYENFIPFNKLQYSVTQLFANRHVNPYDENCRTLFKMGTGAGKTLASLTISKSFSDVSRVTYNSYGKQNSIFILGYSKQVYIREFFKFPELGVITRSEILELLSMEKKLRTAYGDYKENLEQSYRGLKNKIKKRITDPEEGGFYKLIGYRELYNGIFIADRPEGTTAANVYERYKNGEILVNQTLLDSFADSLVICDEVHMIYNSKEMNNYGLAIQLIIDHHKNRIHAVYLSATIISNDKREIVDIANLMRDPYSPTFVSEDYFRGESVGDLQPIYDAFKGKVIFLEENNKDYPDFHFIGKEIKGIDFLKFTECIMTPLHEHTYAKAGLFDTKTNNNMIHDLVVPNPDFSLEEHLRWDPSHPEFDKRNMDMVGLFDSVEVKQRLMTAPAAWKKEMGIEITVAKEGGYIIGGSWLKYDRVKIFSKKAQKFLDILKFELERDPLIKMLVFHPYVMGSGITMIGELLSQNGYCHYHSSSRSDTFSSELYITKREWQEKYPNKTFHPAKFFTLSKDVSKQKETRVIDEYNAVDNKYGKNIKLFLGSQKIKQSCDFKDIQLVFIWHYLTNIPELRQLIGRAVRTNSMIALPKNKRLVRFYTFMSASATGRRTIENKKYKKKVEEFKIIQEIELNINKHAVNNFLHKKDFEKSSELGALSFSIDKRVATPHKKTYFDFEWYNYATELISMLIKRAFIANPVWTHEDLWLFVSTNKAVNVDMEMDTLYKELFNYVLSRILFVKSVNITNMSMDLFDIANVRIDRYHVAGVTRRCVEKAITQIGRYFVLCPVDEYGNIELYQYSFLKKNQLEYTRKYDIKVTEVDLNLETIVKQFLKSDKHKYFFLLALTEKEHYIAMKTYIETKNVLTKELFSVYEDLKIAGKSWYLDKGGINKLENGQWERYPKDVKEEVIENNAAVGIVDSKVFKMRDANSYKDADKRKNQRGMTCTMNKKEKLNYYHKSLGLKLKSKNSVPCLCTSLFLQIVDLEIAARRSKKKLKYLYTFEEDYSH